MFRGVLLWTMDPLFPATHVHVSFLSSVGSVLGLALVLTAHCSDEHKHRHVHVTQSLDKLVCRLHESSGQERLLQEVQTTVF